jgi:YD repeat-containing protein
MADLVTAEIDEDGNHVLVTRDADGKVLSVTRYQKPLTWIGRYFRREAEKQARQERIERSQRGL